MKSEFKIVSNYEEIKNKIVSGSIYRYGGVTFPLQNCKISKLKSFLRNNKWQQLHRKRTVCCCIEHRIRYVSSLVAWNRSILQIWAIFVMREKNCCTPITTTMLRFHSNSALHRSISSQIKKTVQLKSDLPNNHFFGYNHPISVLRCKTAFRIV